MSNVTPFGRLASVDVVVDAIYEGGTAGNVADDPIGRLVPVGNQGGFRYAGSVKDDDLRMVVLSTSGDDQEWPDTLDGETGLFTYFGDNLAAGAAPLRVAGRCSVAGKSLRIEAPSQREERNASDVRLQRIVARAILKQDFSYPGRRSWGADDV